MPKTDMASLRNEAERSGLVSGGKGDYLKLKEGNNRVRILDGFQPHQSFYRGKPTFKWICYVIDRVDGKVKPWFMAHAIYKQIQALQESEDYGFEGVPMPYDLTIRADGAGTIEVKYSVMPARKETPITSDEQAALKELPTLAELSKTLKEKAEKPQELAPESDDDDSRVPF